jgi:GDP-L-fucose synthase
MKNVLLTGGSGFLGKHLQAYFIANGIACEVVSSKTINLTVQADLQQIPKRDYDHIFHLAAWTQAGDFCSLYAGDQWVINQQINTNVLQWWRDNCPSAKMIAFGTSVSYASEKDLIEDKYMDGQPYQKFYAYAMSKRMLLAGLQCMQQQFGMHYLYVIPSTMYGSGYHTDGRQMHFIYDLARKILRGKLFGETVTLWGDGEQRRELVYVDDFIKILMALNQHAQNDIFNIGSGDDNSIKDFAKIICEIVDYDFDLIQYDTTQYVGAKSKILDVQKYRSITGDIGPATALHIGVQSVVDWLVENKQTFLQPHA